MTEAKITTTIRLSAPLYERLAKERAVTGLTFQNILTKAIQAYFDQKDTSLEGHS